MKDGHKHLMRTLLFAGALAACGAPVGTPTPIVASTENPTGLPTVAIPTFIQGVNYNPIENGSYITDRAAMGKDVDAMAGMHANTIGLYNCGKFDWNEIRGAASGEEFCSQIYPLAEAHNVNLILGFYSNETQNWEDAETRERATAEFQEMVRATLDKKYVASYMIGNEIFEKLPKGNENAKIAYAKWIGEMVVWAKGVTPEKPVFYADNSILTALPYLKEYAPELSMYAINDYEWGNAYELVERIDRVQRKWNIPVLLHEWGSDSFDVRKMMEDKKAQADRLVYLSGEIEKARQMRPQFMGALLFEYTDEPQKVGDPMRRDADHGANWTCKTCFDGKANEDWWGIKGKPASESLQATWQGK